MTIQPAQPIPGNGQQPDQQSLCRCHDMHDCPDQATTLINTAQLARVTELLDVLDGFLRHADGIAHRLADYLHTTRHHPPRTGAGYDANLLIDKSASPHTPCASTATNRYSKHPSPVSSFTEQD